jgi:hypothetical protein
VWWPGSAEPGEENGVRNDETGGDGRDNAVQVRDGIRAAKRLESELLEDQLLFVSSTSRTLRASDSGVNGFCKKADSAWETS